MRATTRRLWVRGRGRPRHCVLAEDFFDQRFDNHERLGEYSDAFATGEESW